MRKATNIKLLIMILLAMSVNPHGLFAQSSSTNYQVEEFTFGAGGTNDASSANYQGRASIGDLGVGNSSSANFQVYGGFTTTDKPYLEFVVPAQAIDLQELDTGSTATQTGTFYVRSYLATGYVVQTTSDGLQNDAYTLTNLSSPTAPVAGTEQFGINLVANTSPTTVGEDPEQLPDPSFSYGYAATGYDTPNVYKYVKDDIIARSDSSSGITDYTITYMANVDQSTPGGVYTMDHSLVATSTF